VLFLFDILILINVFSLLACYAQILFLQWIILQLGNSIVHLFFIVVDHWFMCNCLELSGDATKHLGQFDCVDSYDVYINICVTALLHINMMLLLL
jgi:hypothetical protein